MQYAPRKRSSRIVARVRSWHTDKEPRPVGFAGYKAGMTHAMVIDNRTHSKTKGREIFMPITVIECPPLKISSIRFYKKTASKRLLVSETFTEKPDKELSRKITLPKKMKKRPEDVKPESYDEIRVLAHTQPRLTGIGKKKPELVELALGGRKDEQLSFAKENLGKEVRVEDIFKEGAQLDAHAITTGKGYQGPVKRFGIGLKGHKSEKSRRAPGSLGGWKSQGKVMYRVAHAGQMGMQQRIMLNSWLLKIGAKPEEINPKGGFITYGNVRNTYLLVKGSVPGPKKRLITFTHASRPDRRTPKAAPTLSYVSLASKQG